jgi:hypothetical protein
MISFYGYLKVLNEGKTSGKTGLYPIGYQGVGQYPPEYMLPGSADAIYYISADERLQKCWEKEPFKIDHLKPTPIWTKPHGKKLFVAATAKLPPGKEVPFRPLKPDPDEKLIKVTKSNKQPCMASEPKCLPPTLTGKAAEKFGDPCPHTFKMPD